MAYFGIALLVTAAAFFLGGVLGLLPVFETSVFGQSGLRGLASLAVAGCLLAAIGFWED